MPLMYYVDMDAVRAAIATIRTERDTIDELLTGIEGRLDGATTVWSGPAASTFAGLSQQLIDANKDLIDALDSIVARMQTTVDNYQQTETANYYTVGGS
ncbi:WXG100 family type VII secretion target [Micromonospora sp. NBC_01813]|uniref:WXG100 family type VII secretion target n=1 Tax=Micromonospora sp. NBC_01813 TaxID=2975988 RepID=UPI002DDB6BB6|nr:WXG100 family type VII secretion target [Micromonospora sp. NBC_01813]WSA07156.1 WXG100 family type VII secretion target [Micromonospora sp. NBC_01813]